MATIHKLHDEQYYAECQCGSTDWRIMVAGPGQTPQAYKATGIECLKCGKAEKFDIKDGDQNA
jgi:hypothetical protein